MLRSYLGLTAAAIALVVAGCGSSASSSTATNASAATPAGPSSAYGPAASQTATVKPKPKSKAHATAKAKAKAKANAAKAKAAKPKLAAAVKAKPAKVAATPKPKPKAATPPKPKPVASTPLDVGTRTLPPGTVLVDSQGKTLYTFSPDKHSMATCTGSCAAVWPPLMLTGTEKPVATAGVKQSLLGSDPYPGGGHVVTYDGWPLYTFSGDSGPGSANGQGENINGGTWFVISTAGTQVTKK